MNYYYNIDTKESAGFKLLSIHAFGLIGLLLDIAILSYVPDLNFWQFALYIIGSIFLVYICASIPVGWEKVSDMAFDGIPITVEWFIHLFFKLTIVYLFGIFELPSEYKRLKIIMDGQSLKEWLIIYLNKMLAIIENKCEEIFYGRKKKR